jgi:WD40 repeat protein
MTRLPDDPPGEVPPADSEATRLHADPAPAPEVDAEGTLDRPPACEHASTRSATRDPEATEWPGGGDGDGLPPSGWWTAASAGRPFQPCRFGEHHLLAEVSRGGMGVVYKAVHLPSGRVVALKMVLPGRLGGIEDVERFRTEARAAARLDHPHITPIYQIGEVDGHHFFTMALATAGTLMQRVREGPLPPRQAAEVVCQLADAVQYAHDQGILHRDIKPHNVLLFAAAEGRSSGGYSGGLTQPADAAGPPAGRLVPRLADFGLAKLQQDSELTRTGTVLGTPSYMPPEQTRGDKGQIGPAADVYSLGALLYCLLTGRPPFQAADEWETMRQVREEEPVPPHALNPGVPRDLESVCLRCLAKEPGRRYGSARELGEDLDRFLHGKPTVARPVGALERGWRWCRRNAAVAGLLAGLMLTLLLGAGVASLLAWHAGREADRARDEAERARKAEIREALRANEAVEAQQKVKEEADRARQAEAREAKRADEAKKEAEKARKAEAKEAVRAKEGLEAQRQAETEKMEKEKQLERAEWVTYVNQIALAQREWEHGSVALAWRHLEACQWNLRGWEHDFLYSQFTRNQRTLRGHGGPVTCVAYSPDGRRIVSGGQGDPTLKVWDAARGTVIMPLKGNTGTPLCVAYSPDGKRIVSGGDNMLRLWDARTGQQVLSFHGDTRFVGCVAYSPDGKHIAGGNGDRTVKVWDAANGALVHSLKGHTGDIGSVAYSPDGKHLVSGGGHSDQTVKVWDAAKGVLVRSLEGHGDWSKCVVAWSPDGKQLVSGGTNGILKVWDSARWQEILTLKGHRGAIHCVAYSPDGKRIVSGSGDDTESRKPPELKVWDAVTGTELHSLKGHAETISCIAYSPDGKHLVSGSWDTTLKVWNADKDTEVLTIKGHTNGPFCVACSPDGKRLVIGCTEGLKVWDATRGTMLFRLEGHTGGVYCVAYSPDSKRIVSSSYAEGKPGEVLVWDADRGIVSHSCFVETLAGSAYNDI